MNRFIRIELVKLFALAAILGLAPTSAGATIITTAFDFTGLTPSGNVSSLSLSKDGLDLTVTAQSPFTDPDFVSVNAGLCSGFGLGVAGGAHCDVDFNELLLLTFSQRVAGGGFSFFIGQGTPFGQLVPPSNIQMQIFPTNNGDFFALAEVRVNWDRVPEPATVALFGAGLVLVGWTRRRRRPADTL